MSNNTMPERLWAARAPQVVLNTKELGQEYIRADVAQAQIDAERKRIVDAINAIVGMNPSFDVHLYAQAIKAAVWNDEDDPQEILKRELKRMPK